LLCSSSLQVALLLLLAWLLLCAWLLLLLSWLLLLLSWLLLVLLLGLALPLQLPLVGLA
jgi:hypothetical protein